MKSRYKLILDCGHSDVRCRSSTAISSKPLGLTIARFVVMFAVIGVLFGEA